MIAWASCWINSRVVGELRRYDAHVTPLWCKSGTPCISQKIYTLSFCALFWCGPWWRHQMETFSSSLAISAYNSPVTGEFPAQRAVTRSFDFSLICDLNRTRYDVIVMVLSIRRRFLWFIYPYSSGLFDWYRGGRSNTEVYGWIDRYQSITRHSNKIWWL